jgi:diguanylate cyclase (GGDEF)-like protein/PAS domain S-box-containing protein
MADGRIKHVQERCETCYGPDGTPLRSIGTVQDLTDRVLVEEALRESEERLRTVADYTYDWEYWRGADNEFLYISPACQRVTGYSPSEFLADPALFLRIVHPEDRPRMEQHLQEEFHEEENSLDFRILRRDGEQRWLAHGCRPVFARRDGRFLGRRASNRDITDRKALEQALKVQAETDYLTGLASRRHFRERGEEELIRARRYQRPLALLMLDIDHFKAINDAHGHDVGDLALQRVAARCKEVLRAVDLIGRVGGEEFAIVLPETDAEGGRAVAERLRQAIAERPMATGQGREVWLRASIGVTGFAADEETDLDRLLRQADQALYQAKETGRDRVCLYRTPSIPG